MTNESRSNGSHNNYNNDGVVILDPDLHCGTDDGCCNVEEPKKSAFETMWKHNLKDMAAICCAEFVGTAILLYGGCLCTVQLGGDNSLAGPLGFGFTVSVVICIFGPISAAHINPAVTLCAALYGSIEYKMILVYVPAQIGGALVGFALLMRSLPWSHVIEKMHGGVGICLTQPHAGIEWYSAFICEFCFTAILVLVCCGLWDKRASHLQDSVALKFAVTVAALSIAGGDLTGASMNPARSLAPAIWNDQMQNQWLYWVAPLSASLCTTLAYKSIFRRECC